MYSHADGEQRGKRGVDGTAHGLPDALLADDLKRLLARGAQVLTNAVEYDDGRVDGVAEDGQCSSNEVAVERNLQQNVKRSA